ncbi:MAG TPA: hypothetical protein VK116_16925, partial [Planctomycetota bacterium]|nr:hypothetical protein [Planctomycetota bacterium]
RDDIEENRRAHLLGRLVESLADRDESVRFFSGIALRKATGVDHGFAAHAPESERATAVERWRAWLARATEPPRDGDDELEANDDREEDGSEPASIASPREPNEGTVR